MPDNFDQARASPAGCAACTADPFAGLPPELRPLAKPVLGKLR